MLRRTSSSGVPDGNLAASCMANSISSSASIAHGHRSISIVSAAFVAEEVTSERRVPLVKATGTPGVKSGDAVFDSTGEDIIKPCSTSGLSARCG